MKLISLMGGRETVVDDDIYNLYGKLRWRVNKGGYVVCGGGNKVTFLHRLVANTPKDMTTDHINNNRLDNLRSNLRVVNEKENHYNQIKRKNNTSGYKGVWYRKERGRWQAEICKDGKKESLGCWNTPEEAAVVYNQRAKVLFGEHARLNEILV